MPKYKYGFKGKEGEKYARAQQYNIDASYKDLVEVCRNVKNMLTDNATKYLEEVIEMKRPVRYYRYAKRLGSRRELGGKKGRYPKKAANIVLNTLKNAIANADQIGILNPKIIHISANKQTTYPRLQPKGGRRGRRTDRKSVV